MADEQEKPGSPPRKWWRRKRWWLLGFVVVALVWLDGPGWRWIGQKAAARYFPELGIEGSFNLQGRLSSGTIGIRKVELGGDTVLNVLKLDKAEINYSLGKIFKGRIESVEISGLVADINLDASADGPEEKKEKPAPDIPKVLRSLRERILPVRIELRDVSARIRKAAEPVFAIGSTSIVHESGSDDFTLDLGVMDFPQGRRVEAQQSRLVWKEDALELASLDVMPGLGIRDLTARLPADGSLDFATGILVNDVRFNATSDLESATLTKEDGPLSIHDTAMLFALDLPATATLDRLEVDARNLSGGLATLDAEVELGLSGIDYDGWTSPRLALAARLEGDQLRAVLKGEALGSPLDLVADATVDRASNLLPTEIRADFGIPQFDRPLTLVRDRFVKPDPATNAPAETGDAALIPDPVVEEEELAESAAVPRPDPPASSLKGRATAKFDQGKPSEATAEIEITSSAKAPPIDLDATWSRSDGAAATLAIPGIKADGSFDPEARSYAGTAALDAFDPRSLVPWLAPFGIKVPEGMTASLTWSGNGSIPDQTHSGDLELSSFEWQRGADQQPLKAFATASYAWPETLSLTPLNVQQAAQKIEGDLTLENQILSLKQLSWSDGDDILLNGTAEIPVPDDPTDWKALLRQDRPVAIDIESTELPLTKLHPFLPETTRFPDSSRAKLSVKLSGTPAAPVLNASLTGTRLGLANQPDIPPANLEMEIVGKDQTLKVEGSIIAEGYPPTQLAAVTNWSPDQWAEDPATLKAAKLDASAKLENLNLSQFSRFVPAARRIEGVVNLNVEVTGTVGEPEPLGTLTLDGGRFEMNDATVPRLKDAALKVIATPEKLTMENLNATVSGGTLAINGSLDLKDGKPTALDFRIDGKALPARRDSSMIVRINTDLSLSGPWESATLGGSISIIDSLFFRDIEILPIGVPFNQPSEPSLPAVDAPAAADLTAAVPEPFRNWGLDLKLFTANPFLIRGNLATGEVYLNVAVGGTVARPRPTGEATLREISAKLPFSTMRIDSGLVRFQPDAPFDPVLDIRARSTIRPYDIEFFVYGPISDPQILPNSNPPLPDTEIMTLVATGTTTAGFEDPQAATARAAQLLIEEIRRGRISTVRGLQPVLALLDRVDFQVGERDPFTSARFNSATINIDDNWMVRAGMSEEGTTRTTLIYLFRFR